MLKGNGKTTQHLTNIFNDFILQKVIFQRRMINLIE